MRFLRTMGTVGLCCRLLGACTATVNDRIESYVVRPQDTLYSIAWRHDLDYRDLARWNKIGADFRISVGQVLLLGPSRRAPGRPMAARPPRPQSLPRPQNPALPQSLPRPQNPALPQSPAKPTVPQAAGEGAKWVWPTDRAGAPQSVPGGGLLLYGRLGQDVRAAGAGRVVYSGSGLRGYGNLIIIKHADSLLSAYAHNRDILVQDGQNLAVGQLIAHMGQSEQQLPVLYFEVRQNGKPIDPLPLLPK